MAAAPTLSGETTAGFTAGKGGAALPPSLPCAGRPPLAAPPSPPTALSEKPSLEEGTALALPSSCSTGRRVGVGSAALLESAGGGAEESGIRLEDPAAAAARSGPTNHPSSPEGQLAEGRLRAGREGSSALAAPSAAAGAATSCPTTALTSSSSPTPPLLCFCSTAAMCIGFVPANSPPASAPAALLGTALPSTIAALLVTMAGEEASGVLPPLPAAGWRRLASAMLLAFAACAAPACLLRRRSSSIQSSRAPAHSSAAMATPACAPGCARGRVAALAARAPATAPPPAGPRNPDTAPQSRNSRCGDTSMAACMPLKVARSWARRAVRVVMAGCASVAGSPVLVHPFAI